MGADLAAFLRDRLDEDEAAALDTPGTGRWEVQGYHVVDPSLPKSLGPVASFAIGAAAHVARHDPPRVLREVKAKRAILAAYEAVLKECATMLRDRRPRKYGEHDGLRLAVAHLAAVYSDHPDYREEWKP